MDLQYADAVENRDGSKSCECPHCGASTRIDANPLKPWAQRVFRCPRCGGRFRAW